MSPKKLVAIISFCMAAFLTNVSSAAESSRINIDISNGHYFANKSSVSLEDIREEFGLSKPYSLKKIRSNTDNKGNTHTRYQVYFHNTMVYSRQLVTHRNANNKLYRVTGFLPSGIEADLKARDFKVRSSISEKIALNKLKGLNRKALDIKENVKLSIKRKKIQKIIHVPDNGAARLAYLVSFFSEGVTSKDEPEVIASRPFALVDADNGDVLEYWDGLAHKKIPEADLSQKAGDSCMRIEAISAKASGDWEGIILSPLEVFRQVGEQPDIQFRVKVRNHCLFAKPGPLAWYIKSKDGQILKTGQLNFTKNPPGYLGTREKQFWANSFGTGINKIKFENRLAFGRVKVNTYEKIGIGPGGNVKVGRYEYGSGKFDSLDITSVEHATGTTCYLENDNVKTVNLDHETNLDGDPAHSFECPRNTVKQINGAYSPLNDAHYFGTAVFNMYQDWFDLQVLQTKLVLRAHYGKNYQNAFWNGETMNFGDGGLMFYPLVSLDVVSHEVSHGFTEVNSDLVYRNQSGGINEAFSDIAGVAAEYYLLGEGNWMVGESTLKRWLSLPPLFLDALRYMNTPSRDGVSIDHADQYKEGMDVHYSSGVYNKAFYLLATTDGWNIKQAFEVMVRANQNYWTKVETFDSAACGVENAAQDLGHSVSDVRDAFSEVGVQCHD